jgi:hypothetical protein
VSAGDRVRIKADGREGVVTASSRRAGCSCRTVFVRLERGEWAGKASELRRLP